MFENVSLVLPFLFRYVPFFVAFIVGFALRINAFGEKRSCLISCIVCPILILLQEFVLPYMGGGASLWIYAIVPSFFYSGAIGGLGVLVASFLLKRRSKNIRI